MPFDFLKRRKDRPAVGRRRRRSHRQPLVAAAGIPFDGLTEDWRLVGRMLVDGRLSDALNKREPIAIADVQWAPVDGSEPLAPAPGLKSVDPYDLVLVLAGEDSLPEMSEAGADRPPGPQGLVRGGPGGPALPRRRDRLPLSGLRAGPSAPALVRDVRPDRGCHGDHGRSPGRARQAAGHPRQPRSTCEGSSRWMPGRASASRRCRAPRWAASTGPTGPVAHAAAASSGASDQPALDPAQAETGLRGGRLTGRPSTRSASVSKSAVILSRGNISMTVRPSLAARTKSRPPDRIWAKRRHARRCAPCPRRRRRCWLG